MGFIVPVEGKYYHVEKEMIESTSSCRMEFAMS